MPLRGLSGRSEGVHDPSESSPVITGVKDLLGDIGISDKYFKSNKVGCGRGDFNGDGFEDYFFINLKMIGVEE
ncbi:MAG: hypothetical protein ACE5HC_16850 [Candidatus Binatia bacterium]